MNVHVKIIPHKKQRYDTVGDWWFDKKGDLQIRVSRMKDRRYEQLVSLHEQVEALLCDEEGITEEEVTAFDIGFLGVGEPGNQTNCPYALQHKIATQFERTLAIELGVDWNSYEQEINGLKY
jgi:hypothetical protein